MKPRPLSRVVWLAAISIDGKPEPSTLAVAAGSTGGNNPAWQMATTLTAHEWGIEVRRGKSVLLVPWANVKWAEE